MLVISGEKYFVEKELSVKYGLSVYWLRRARYNGKTPVYHKLNGKVFYKEADVDQWFKENLIPSH